jgi:hypothetical protein
MNSQAESVRNVVDELVAIVGGAAGNGNKPGSRAAARFVPSNGSRASFSLPANSIPHLAHSNENGKSKTRSSSFAGNLKRTAPQTDDMGFNEF